MKWENRKSVSDDLPSLGDPMMHIPASIGRPLGLSPPPPTLVTMQLEIQTAGQRQTTNSRIKIVFRRIIKVRRLSELTGDRYCRMNTPGTCVSRSPSLPDRCSSRSMERRP